MKFPKVLLLAFILAASSGIFAQLDRNHPGMQSFAPTGSTRSETAALNAIEQDAFQLINVERGKAGLPALKWNERLAKVARLHSDNMAEYRFFSHKGVDGLMVDERADKLGLGEWRAIGENIAFMQGFPNPAEVAVEKWLLSASHRSNLLNPQWSDSGLGVAKSPEGKMYFTQVFLVRK